MRLSQLVSFGVCFFGISLAWASADDYDGYSTVKRSSINIRKTDDDSEFATQRLSLVLPSFVIHGIQPDAENSAAMPRRLNNDGNAVVTPGFGLQYIDETGVLVLGAVVKDCYDNLAGTLQLGHMFELSDRTSWGITFGIYARQTPMSCAQVPTGRGGYYSDCTALDNYKWKILTYVNGQPVDVIPMPFLHFTTALYKGKDFRLDFKLMSNVVLNEFGIAVPF